MKNFSILTLLAALLFVGCSDIFVELESPLTNEITLPNLTANFADDGLTRTYVEAGKYLRWHEADLITAFFGNTLNRQYKFNGATGANSGTFSLVPDGELGTGNTLDAIYAIYPYDASATISDDGLISLTLPSEQSYAENSFGKGANTMVAVTESVEDTFLSFKNACGYLKLYLYNVDGATLKSVSVKGNNNEKIAGAATVAMTFGDTPEVTMSNDATTSVTLDCGEGIALGTTSETATALWIVLPETTFEEGITITVTDTEGGVFEKSTSNSVAITRNDIQPMAALAVEFVAPVVKPANNEIWYTNGSTTEATTPNSTDAFGVNILSNTYDAEKECWVIKFDGEVTKIGDKAFHNCSSLTSVTIPDSVTTIGNYAFVGCEGLTSVTIPDSVTTIGEDAFVSCSSLTSVNIPNSVTTIGEDAFHCCWMLQEFKGKFASEDGRCLIIEGVLNSFAPAGLTEYAIPNSVTTIGHSAFYDCSSLTSITIPDSVTSIGDYAFNYCSSLTSINIPDGVTSIGEYAFYDCSSLTSVTIPDSVTTIGEFAFCYCSSLTSVYCEATTPPTVDYTMFYDNASDRKIYVPRNSVDAYKSASGWSSYASDIVGYDFATDETLQPANNEIWYTNGSTTEATTPSKTNAFGVNIVSNTYDAEKECWVIKFDGDVTKIGDEAFYWCSSLTSVTIPDSVTTIGNYAFVGCEGLTSVTIPNSVTTIGNDAFYGCSSLTSVTIPDSVTTIGYSAFRDCSQLQEFKGKFASDDGRCLIIEGVLNSFAPAGLTEYVIPNSVTTIGDFAFHNCSSLTSVTIPDSVTTIGNYAFVGCEGLTSVTIPDSVTTIGNFAFQYCSSLTSVTIPDSVTTIGEFAFSCTSLTSVNIPDSVTTIGEAAFSNCRQLQEFKGKFASDDGRCLIQDGTLIAFAPAGLTEYAIPNSVITIGYEAFYFCTSLTSVTIPDSVTTIRGAAFFCCTSLTSVYCEATTPPTVDYTMFYDNASDLKIYVPRNSVEAYKSASDWSEYASYIVGYDF